MEPELIYRRSELSVTRTGGQYGHAIARRAGITRPIGNHTLRRTQSPHALRRRSLWISAELRDRTKTTMRYSADEMISNGAENAVPPRREERHDEPGHVSC